MFGEINLPVENRKKTNKQKNPVRRRQWEMYQKTDNHIKCK